MNPYFELSIVLVFLVALSFIVVLIIRYTSYWNRLEKLYLTQTVDLPKNYGLQWINIASPVDPTGSFNRFGWIIRAGANSEGICFSIVFPFHVILRPILIPWADAILTDQAFIGINRHELIPKQLPETQLILSGKLMEQLIKFRSGL